MKELTLLITHTINNIETAYYLVIFYQPKEEREDSRK